VDKKLPHVTADVALMHAKIANPFVDAINSTAYRYATSGATIIKSPNGYTYDLGAIESKVNTLSNRVRSITTDSTNLLVIEQAIRKITHTTQEINNLTVILTTLTERYNCAHALLCDGEPSTCDLSAAFQRTWTYCHCGFVEFQSFGQYKRFYNRLEIGGERLLTHATQSNVASTNCIPTPNPPITVSKSASTTGTGGSGSFVVTSTATNTAYADCAWNSGTNYTPNIHITARVQRPAYPTSGSGSKSNVVTNCSIQLEQLNIALTSYATVTNTTVSASATASSSNQPAQDISNSASLTTGTFTLNSTAARLCRWRFSVSCTGGTTVVVYSNTFAPGTSPNGPLGDLITGTKEFWSGAITRSPVMVGEELECQASGTITKTVKSFSKHCACDDDYTESTVSTTDYTDADAAYALAMTFTAVDANNRLLSGIIGTSCLATPYGVLAQLLYEETIEYLITVSPYTDEAASTTFAPKAQYTVNDASERCGTVSKIYYTVNYVGEGNDVRTRVDSLELSTSTVTPLYYNYYFISSETADEIIDPVHGKVLTLETDLAGTGCEIVS
jgi:hypothetical protein